MAEVSALAQQRNETGECRAPRSRERAFDPRAQAVGRRDPSLTPPGASIVDEVASAGLDAAHHVRVARPSPPPAVCTPAAAAAL